jgi:predicted ATPase
MIKKLRLKNFLSYKDVTINFNDFNVILGANASGKTNLTKALIALRELIIGGFQTLDDFDAYTEAIFNKNASEQERLLIEIDLADEIEIPLFPTNDKIIAQEQHYSLELALGKGVVAEKYWLKLKGKKEPFKVLDRNENQAKYTFDYKPDFSSCLKMEFDATLLKLLKYQPMAGKSYSGFLMVLFQSFCEYFFAYILSSEKLITPFSSRNQTLLTHDGQNLSGVLEYYKKHNKQVITDINDILRRNIPNLETLDTKAMGTGTFYFIVREKDGKEYGLRELSDGTALFIGLVTAMVTCQYLNIRKGQKGILIIEEPEKNLHPQLMEQIVKLAKSLTDKFQVIITTHSTDLVAHLSAEDIILLDKNESGTRLQRINKTEELERYLEEFSLDQIWLNNDLGGGTIDG